jgi:FAD binding domain/D-arabinono-1,4-lactone oxidase
MADIVVTNWFGDLVSHAQAVAEAASADDVVNVLKNPAQYPSPVRAVGANHSTAPCAVVNGGTILKMSGMNKILDISNGTVTAEGGALYIDVAKELEKQKLQFYVNTEIGNLSVGSAACCGTKDSSMPGEFGQVGSYVTRIKMALPSGDFLEVTSDQPELMQKVRSSYGTFGIVTEATFRVRPILPMAVHHQTFTLDDFIQKLPSLKAGGESLMFYIFPFDNLITVEFRKYDPAASGDPNCFIWPLRNYLWASAGPLVCANAENDIADKTVRYQVIDAFNKLWRWKLENLIQSGNTVATDQIIRYPPTGGPSRYTFSFWAFPEQIYPAVLRACFQFCQQYYQQNGYRVNMLFVGYYVAQDQNSLLSYSYDGNVMTIDPVSTANPGWDQFEAAYNGFCSDQGGIPLFNQTYGITPAQAQKAWGDKLKVFAAARQNYDPNGRLLNDYFRDLLGS